MRLLVVSRSPMMAMTLRAESFDVLDLRPPKFGDWLNSTDDDVDALVLDLADPRVALEAVIELRARARMCPALLVSGEQEGWDDLAVQDLPAARVLPLPVTRPALLSALSDLLVEQEPTLEDPAEAGADIAVTVDEPSPVAPDTGVGPAPASEPTQREHDADETANRRAPHSAEQTDSPRAALALPAEPSAVVAVAIPLAAPLAREPGDRQSQQTETAPLIDATGSPSTRSEPAPTEPANHVAGSSTPAEAADQAAPTLPPPAASPPPPPILTQHIRPAEVATGQLVKLLQERLPDLISVSEVADVVIADAIDRVAAEAGALLVPDGASWRVSGGVGLRRLEQRLELDESSWLVTEVAHAGQGVIVEDSDIARNPLKGAPLASWRHILLAPIALVEAILVLARAEAPFDESDLTRLVALSKEAGPLIQAAMETRALARSLAAFTDGE